MSDKDISINSTRCSPVDGVDGQFHLIDAELGAIHIGIGHTGPRRCAT